MDPVRDISIGSQDKVSDIIEKMGQGGGFQAKYLYLAFKILERMIKDNEALKFLSFPACIVATGVRGILKEMLRRKWFDVVITTNGTLDHDFARLFSDYYIGEFDADDVELEERGIHRLGNVFVPMESYGITIEKHLLPILEDIYKEKRDISTYELVWEIGKRLEDHPKKEESIIYWCYKNKIPVIIPGPLDGAVGWQCWRFHLDHSDFKIDVMKDEDLLNNLIWEAKRTGALIIGGGISKHHVIWWNQFKGGLDYAVYITTAVEWDGSLSGARTREAISWGKIKKDADHVTLYSDATLVLPFLFKALTEVLQ